MKGGATARSGARNMRLLSHHALDGFGNVGEGMSIQLTRDRRRILWLAHESAPKNVTAVDVTDPRKPAVVLQTDLPHERMRSNNLEVVGDILVIAYQTREPGLTPAGFDILDVADPRRPKKLGFFDASGPASRGVHHLWFVDGTHVHCAAGAPDFTPRNGKDDQCYRIVDIGRPSQPGGGRPLVAARHPRRRRGAAAPAASDLRHRVPRPQHQRLSPAPGPRLHRLSGRRGDRA